MATKLKIVPLGGLNEVGKNLTVYSYGRDMIVVDCGMGFPDEDMYGVDVVVPDISWLEENRSRIKGIFITHGHEDHIGALPYVIDRINAPIYATRLTAGLIKLKLDERRLTEKTKIITVEAGSHIKAGCFDVEFIHVNHSISDSVAFAIKTPIGTVVHTGDFKIDVTPIRGDVTDLTRFGELGKQGVLALLMDSTNVERAGFSDSESSVFRRFDGLFKDCEKRIIVTTFASNVDRIQQVLTLAQKYKRKVAVTGRSMENVVQLASELGYMDIPDGLIVDLKHINKLPPQKVVILSTGSQGESMSALYRMAFNEHKQIDIGINDRVILSASAIPGNENTVTRVIDELIANGAEVVYEKGTALHVSGHACQEELKLLYALVRPKFFVPVHGERHMLQKHAQLAQFMGQDPKNIFIGENGRAIEFTAKSMKSGDMVQAGNILVDGIGTGEIGSVVLRDRKTLADEGMIVVVLTVSSYDGGLISGPEIITRGFVYEKESAELLEELRRVANESIDSCFTGKNRHNRDWQSVKNRMRSNMSGFLYKTTRRSPMILPIIMEI